MFLHVAKSLFKGGRVALLLYEGSSMSGPGEVTVLSTLQEGCLARNPSTSLCEKLKVALTSEMALVYVCGNICSTLHSTQLIVAQRGPLRPCSVLAFPLQQLVCSFLVARLCS